MALVKQLSLLKRLTGANPNKLSVRYYDHEKLERKRAMTCRKDQDLFLVLVDDNMVDPCWDLPKVVIVGAGMAGLSAAHALTKAGIRDVTVLEAMDRPGGRIMSCNMRSFIVDLGASYIEGATPGNPVYNLAAQEGLFSDTSPLAENPYVGTFMNCCAEVASPLIQSTAHHVFRGIEAQAADIYAKGIRQKGNLQSFLEDRIIDEVSCFPHDQRVMADRVLVGRMNELMSYWGADLRKLSLDQYGAFTALPGEDMRIGSGMVGVLAPIIRDMQEDCVIKYCKPVSKIKWANTEKEEEKQKKKKKKKNDDEEPQRPVKVVMCDGEKIDCDYVIVTCSLGHLKKNYERMFTPALPKEKAEAINLLGYGDIDHIYLLYAEPFWVWKEGVVRFAWSKAELKNKDNWLTGIGWIRELPTSVQVLQARVGGEQARKMEKMCPNAVGEDITRMLRQFTGDPTLPCPYAVLTSKWSTNQFQLGAKTYIREGSNLSHICTMGNPVPDPCGDQAPTLLFAGEATVPGYFGTMHGARMSGLREAERIIKLTHKFEGRPTKKDDSPCYSVQAV